VRRPLRAGDVADGWHPRDVAALRRDDAKSTIGGGACDGADEISIPRQLLGLE
jgi:hypothetical protein